MFLESPARPVLLGWLTSRILLKFVLISPSYPNFSRDFGSEETLDRTRLTIDSTD
jgi:hypothetical protein